MNRDQRLEAILDLLSSEGNVEVTGLVDRFDVSPATARRDLDELATRRLVQRTHGGASKEGFAYDLPRRFTRSTDADQKQRIAEHAAALVSPGDIIALTGGTTTAAIAAAITTREDLSEPGGITIVTNAINVATQLALRPHVRVVVTGGILHERSYELVGPMTEDAISRMNVDIAFVGVDGLTAETGPTVDDVAEAYVNRSLARSAREAWIVADAGKIGRRALARVGELDEYRGLITTASADTLAPLRAAGLRVIEA